MNNHPIPALDQFADQCVTPQMETVLSQRAEMYFLERHPEFRDFTPDAIQKLRQWCHVQCIPISLRNLEVAFNLLQADGSVHRDTGRLTVDAIERFKEQCADWRNFQSQKNGDILAKWIEDHGLEATSENLFKAFNFCVAHKLIRPTPIAQGIISEKNTVVVREAVTPEDRQQYRDDKFASDTERKKQDQELRLAATRARLERRKASQ
jgi:hypothetical protein